MPEINTQINEELTEVSAQKSGAENLDDIDYEAIVKTASNWTFEEKEQWVKKLSGRRIKTYYTDASYNVKDNDVFYEDSERFGAVMQVITMEMPEIIENRSWTAITSGVTTIGSNVAYLPVVDQQLVGGTSSWEVPVCFTGVQMNAAFNSASELKQFDNYVDLVAQNAIKFHKQNLAGVNRNNYIIEKIKAMRTQTNRSHLINLVEEYCKQYGISSMTATAYLADEKCMRHAVKTFKKYKALLSRITTLFTTKLDTKGKFIPSDRFVFQVLSDFEGLIESSIYSNTYHNEFVKLPLYRDVASWQALTTPQSAADFRTLSSIKTDGVNAYGIVAVMVDKWAIMHTMVQNRVGYQRDDIKDITMLAHQFTDRYINNLDLNGCVFAVNDYSA